jgi:hypothetical protein
MRNTLNFVLFLLLAAWQAPVIAAPLQGNVVHLVGEFTGSEKVRKSVSGIACAPADGDTRQCLVALDEKLSAQWATLTLGSELTLIVGDPIKLFKKNAVKPEELPQTSCPEGLDEDADEADSEGVAFARYLLPHRLAWLWP